MVAELIVLSGYAGSGKDTAADVLVEEFGFTKVAYADKLREALYVLNPMVSDQTFLADVIDEHGWQGYKKTEYSDEVRRLIQTLGTEVGRDMMGENVWVDATYDALPDDARVVVTDGRFINELDAARARYGYVWRIERDGVGPLNNHSSETEAVDYPFFSLYLHNNGTLEQFKALVIREYRSGRYRDWSY